MKHPTGISPEELSRNYSGSSQFFTPPPLISCVLRGIEFFLRTEFAFPDGLNDQKVAFLDPAAGALEFPLALLRSVRKRLPPINYKRWVETVFFHNSAFFEIDPHLFSNGMTQLIQELIHVFPSNAVKARFFCGNTLIDRNTIVTSHSMQFETDPWQIRDEIPADPNEILVVFGNPPYAISSATKSAWITEKIEDYKTALNRPGEKRILGLKGIQDDYVKFLRFAQWKLCDQSHRGLVAFVINNYFLDGTIFRGLRASLIANFDAIWIIDLHGDPKKRASSSSSASTNMMDENVFEIQTGICLFFGIRLTHSDHHQAVIHYVDVRGSKTSKFQFLDQDFSMISFQTLSPGIDFELVPGNRALEEEYNRFPCMTDIFLENIVGIQSLHDTLITHPDKSVLEQHLNQFYSSDLEDQEIIDERGQRWIKNPELVFHDARDWTIANGRMGSYTKALTHIYQWQWRGFDRWWVAYDEHLMTKGSSSFKLMQFLLPNQNNLAIGVSRVSRKAAGDSSVFIVDCLAESHVIEGGSGIGDYLFPLRINSKIRQTRKSDWDHPLTADISNISPEFKSRFPYLGQISDEAIFYYCYALLYTPLYRQRYQPLLKKGFPRVPFPPNTEKLLRISHLGRTLVEYHLLFSPEISIDTWLRSDTSDLTIRDPIYDESTQRIYFDRPRPLSSLPFWIGNISPALWSYEIGGIQQLLLWLKHRTFSAIPKRFGFYRAINLEELAMFLRICCAIQLTLALLTKLDAEYQK